MVKQSELYWENQKVIAQEMMSKLWPSILKAKEELAILVRQHSEYQLDLTEAERHLVPIIQLQPSISAKTTTNSIMKNIVGMSLKDRNALVRLLEKKMEEERKGV